MADAIYPKAKEAFLQGNLDMATANIKAVLVTSAYTYNSAHQYHSDLTGIEETSGNMASKTFTNGQFNAADLTFSATAGSACNAVIIYEDTGVSGTSQLIAYLDSGSGFPVTLGGDVTMVWGTYIFEI